MIDLTPTPVTGYPLNLVSWEKSLVCPAVACLGLGFALVLKPAHTHVPEGGGTDVPTVVLRERWDHHRDGVRPAGRWAVGLVPQGRDACREKSSHCESRPNTGRELSEMCSFCSSLNYSRFLVPEVHLKSLLSPYPLCSAIHILLLPLQVCLGLCFPFKPSPNHEILFISLIQVGSQEMC